MPRFSGPEVMIKDDKLMLPLRRTDCRDFVRVRKTSGMSSMLKSDTTFSHVLPQFICHSISPIRLYKT
jgi:hypothetical protein